MGKYPFLSRIDIFGIPPLFTIRGRPTFQTQFGSVLTIVCASTIIIYISILLNQLFHRKKPEVQTSLLYEHNPPQLKLNKKNFSFAFSLEDQRYKHYIDERIYVINAFQSNLNLQEDNSYHYNHKKLKIIKCDNYNFSLIPKNYQQLPLENLYCIDDDIILEGEYKSSIWNYITINFTKCQNTSENNFKCKSKEEINKILNNGYIGLYISDYTFQPNKFKNPFSIHIKNLYRRFSNYYSKEIICYFKIIEVITDTGYFFQNEKLIKFTSYDYIQDDLRYEESDNFITLKIRVSSKIEYNKRTYIKLQTIFSNVGGMLKIILLVGDYTVYLIRITLYKNYILEFFNLDESEIRLKEVRKIYKLKNPKNKLDSMLNFSFEQDNSSPNNTLANFRYRRYTTTQKKSGKNNNTNNYKQILSSLNSNKESISKNDNSNSINNLNNRGKIDNSEVKDDTFDKEFFCRKPILKNPTKKRENSKKKLTFNNYLNTEFFHNKAYSKDSKAKFPSTIYFKHYFLASPMFERERKRKYTMKTPRNTPRNILKTKTEYILDKKTMVSIPKTKLRFIKVPGFCSDFVCRKNTIKTIKQVHENFKEIQFLLDIVHYLKSENELNIIEKYFFTEEQRKILSYTYSFEADFGLERKGYEYMIRHKKSKLDEEDRKSISKIIS